MKQLSIMDKIKVVIDMTKSNKMFFVILILLLFLSILFATTSRKNAKESKITYGLIYLACIAAIVIKYFKSISSMYDCMMNNLFIVFYFPNISVYVAAIIITNIIIWVNMFSKKSRAIIKAVNSAVFFFMHYILILLLSIIANNNLNVFDSTSLYANKNVHSLIELSSNIFIIWIIFLIVYKIVISYLERGKEEVTVVEKVVVKNKLPKALKKINELDAPMLIKREARNNLCKYIDEVDAPIRVKRDKRGLDKNINLINAPISIKRDERVNTNKTYSNINMVEIPSVVTQKQKINKTVKNIQKTVTTTIYDSVVNTNRNVDLFGDDYKEVLTVLQNEYVPYVKTTKEEELKLERENERKLSQLMDMYRSI
ncbi:MAG: hypothetical protein IK997_00555 [Bacilli bacterium]|nr:hypothetical protein [Bacilli bacterium]